MHMQGCLLSVIINILKQKRKNGLYILIFNGIIARSKGNWRYTQVKASAGAIAYTPVVKVTNLAKTMEELKKRGMWFACADMQGELMYRCNLTGPMGLVIGNEGSGVSRLVKETCDFVVSIPMKGDIDSLNASVAAGVLGYEVVRQRMGIK